MSAPQTDRGFHSHLNPVTNSPTKSIKALFLSVASPDEIQKAKMHALDTAQPVGHIQPVGQSHFVFVSLMLVSRPTLQSVRPTLRLSGLTGRQLRRGRSQLSALGARAPVLTGSPELPADNPGGALMTNTQAPS